MGPTVRALRPAPAPAPHPLAGVNGEDRQITVVAADAVPQGATVLGVLVLLPERVPVSELSPGSIPYPSAGAVHPVSVIPVPQPGGPYQQPGGRGVGPVELRPGVLLDRSARAVAVDGSLLDLTRREHDLLEHLADRPGRVLTREHLLGTVWGYDDPRFAGARTVDVHVARLRRKLGPRHGQALQTVRGIGYRWVP